MITESQASAQPATSLVTGGAGFIGSHVADELVKRNHQVIVLDDLSGGFRENVNPRAKFVMGSITDVKLVEKLFEEHAIDYVYHLAAYAAEGLSHFIRRFNYLNNIVGSMNLINSAVRHKCKALVFTSSIAVYGAGQTPMREDLSPHPEDPYGIAKYAVEMDLKAAERMFGLNPIIFRPHNVYGERQNIGDPYRNVVGIFMNQILQGLACTVFGDGSQTRAFTHISDIAPVIAGSVYEPRAYGQIFNIGADVPYAVKELVALVQHSMGTNTGVRYLPARDEVLHAFSDHSKCEKVFGYKARVSLSDGLQSMADWVKKSGARQGKSFGEIEIEEKLPSSWRKKCTRENQ